MEADGSGVQIHPWLHSKFKAILSCMMKKQSRKGLGGIGDKWHQTGKVQRVNLIDPESVIEAWVIREF